ncbi:hypothetical protein [Humibacter sp.]|uniref:hypothetical protein n=1 Tax=Humibacter sp. TaxID=1940291 RepID=UPI003F7F0DDA
MSDAQWSRTTYRDQARAQADARSADRWSDTDVNYALGLVHTREWKRLLNANPMLRFGARSVAQDASGQIAVSSLDSGSGDSQERFYRVLDVAQDTVTYDEVSFRDVPTATVEPAANVMRAWYRIGDVLQCLPSESGATMTVWVNHTPTPIDRLAGDDSVAEFPRDYELLIAYEAAAWLLMKGGAESDAAKDLQQMAEQIRQDMLADLARQSIQPMQMRYGDRRWEWGG